MEGFIGEVKLFAGTFAPRGWAFCEGQLLSIQQYTALYSILGDQFGGDGRSTFGVPDLRGRVPVGVGAGPGLTPMSATQKGGYERVQITEANLPAHSHAVNCDMTSTGDRDLSTKPEGKVLAQSVDKNFGNKLDGGHHMHASMVNATGGNQPLYNMQPFLGMHYIICTDGEYPQRP